MTMVLSPDPYADRRRQNYGVRGIGQRKGRRSLRRARSHSLIQGGCCWLVTTVVDIEQRAISAPNNAAGNMVHFVLLPLPSPFSE